MIKRKIALILAIVLFASVFPRDVIYAVNVASMNSGKLDYINDNGLDYINQNIVLKGSLGEEEAMFAIDMAATGHYRLEYFVETELEGATIDTYKVEIDWIKGNNQIETAIKVRDKAGNVETLDYFENEWPYTEEPQQENTDEFIRTLKIASNDLSQDSEIGVMFGSMHLKMMYDKASSVLYLETNNIRKSNITEFDLYYAPNQIVGPMPPEAKDSTRKIYKGINAFNIEPTHLYEKEDGGLGSKDILVSSELEVPGSKPGVKVAFEMPKKLTETNDGFEYVYIEDEPEVILRLNEVLPAGSLVEGNQHQVNFNLKNGADIRLDDGTISGKVNIDSVNDKQIVMIDFVKDKEYLGQAGADVSEWQRLEGSMLVNATIEYAKEAGSSLEGIQQEKDIFFTEGYTYTYYEAKRISDTETVFNVKPYNINEQLAYELYRGVSEGDSGRLEDKRFYSNSHDMDFVPLVSRDTTRSYYRVEIGGEDFIKTQTVIYDPKEHATPLEPTHIESISNIYVVPDPGSQVNEPVAIGFDLTWEALPYNTMRELLQKGNIYYELYLHDEQGNELSPIKVFEVSWNDELTTPSNIHIDWYAGVDGGEDSLVTYNAANNRFEASNVILKKNGEMYWETLSDIDHNRREYPSSEEIEHIEEDERLEGEVPGKYYLSLVRVYDEEEEIIVTSSRSKLESLVLEETNEIIHVPQDIKSESVTVAQGAGEEITFNNISLETYVDKMLRPINLKLPSEYQRTYELYLYQDATITDKELEELGRDNIIEASPEDEIVIDAEYLRDNVQIIEIKDDSNSEETFFTLSGLDRNEVYYLKIRVRIEPEDEQGKAMTSRYSVFSKVHTFTTASIPVPPNPDDQIPTTPQDIIVEVINNATAHIKWIESDGIKDRESTYYEIVRVPHNKMDEEGANRLVSVEDILDNNPSYKGFRTKESYVHTYTGEGWEQFGAFLSDYNEFEDNTLTPNTLYYYYIRTVTILDTGEEIRSNWIMNPVTTTPVDKPVGLEIKREWYSYDEKTEAVISFLAPIPQDANIPQDYELEIAVRGEDDDDYRLDYKVRQLTISEDDDYVSMPEYRYFVYRIEGLEPNRRYDIKVRVVDKTKPIESGEAYPRSLYSEYITYRTEYDADREEEDNRFDEYLKKYDQEAAKLRNVPYWTLDSKKTEGIYNYRPSYMESELSKGTLYSLATKEDATVVEYYLPSTFLEEASRKGVTIEAVLDTINVQIRPYTLTEKNEELQYAKEQKENRKIEDYALLLTVYTTRSTNRIYSEETLTPEISIELEVLHLTKRQTQIEAEILEDLDYYIAKYRQEVIEDLEKEIYDRGVVSEEALDRIVERAISKVEAAHEKSAASITEKAIKRSYSVDSLEKPMLLEVALNASNVRGYYRSNSAWSQVSAFKTGIGYAIEATKLGNYIFTGSLIGTDIPTEIPGMNDFISKYGLTDFFSVDYTGMNANVTKRQAYGATARILGSGQKIDYTQYLIQRGIKGLTLGNQDALIRQDEAIYLVMQAYEKLYYKDINAIYISDKQSVLNISAFQPYYIPYIYGAVELGVVKPVNQQVIPSKRITTQEFIKMLMKISPS